MRSGAVLDNPLMPHYFDEEPQSASRRRAVTLRLPDRVLTLATDTGVFGRGGVDRGTLFLLRRAPPPPPGGDLLDIGTGYGPIAITLALRSPGARVYAVDVNRRALDLARDNATSSGAGNVVVAAPDEVPVAARFAAIYSNPPVRVGLATLHPLLTGWLDRLRDDGFAVLVVHRHLGADSLARWLEGQGFACKRLASHDGYRLLAVQPRAVVGDDR